ncbi:MAG: acetyl-CoA hydrolase/transferase C-terminal domain-containing protein [Gammaproteobacteria bacterium]
MTATTLKIDTVEACVDRILETVGKTVRLGLPLGLGKPPEFVNALYQRAKADPTIHLEIYTALSLEVPPPGEGLQKALLGPFFERVFGNYPGLDYMRDLRKGAVPANIKVHEFYFKSGSMLDNSMAQQNYICTNYTHAPRDIISHGVNVLAQTVAHRVRNGRDEYSLSCNPETTLDILPNIQQRKAQGEAILLIGVVNEHLPFMPHDAQIDESILDIVINNKAYYSTLFAPPKMPVTTIDYMIGLHASTLIPDGGTLQIGIGSLGDAIVYGCQLRHQNPAQYQEIARELQIDAKWGDLIHREGGLGAFEKGLYGNSEMFIDGFFTLIKDGILKRRVYEHEGLQRLLNEGKIHEQLRPDTLDVLLQERVIHSRLQRQDIAFLNYFGIFSPAVKLDKHTITTESGQTFSWDIHDDANRRAISDACLGKQLKHGRIMHGGFFLGQKSFYEGLKHLDPETLDAINMTRISYVNQLYGGEQVKRYQRVNARFINTVFLVNLLGAATSDALENGHVVSGVGGQYNFVAQAHELEGARSILMLKSTREKNSHTQSNLVWNYGHTTIPRHLRDIYVTEYGIADVRGKCDSEVIAALVNIADSRFQSDLLQKAKRAGKLSADYTIPEMFRHNTPERLEQIAAKFRANGLLPAFPLGTDFTVEELVVARSLKAVKAKTESKSVVIKALMKTLREGNKPAPEKVLPYLERINLTAPQDLKDRIARTLLIEELESALK